MFFLLFHMFSEIYLLLYLFILSDIMKAELLKFDKCCIT
jgi:hypothetical protein